MNQKPYIWSGAGQAAWVIHGAAWKLSHLANGDINKVATEPLIHQREIWYGMDKKNFFFITRIGNYVSICMLTLISCCTFIHPASQPACQSSIHPYAAASEWNISIVFLRIPSLCRSGPHELAAWLAWAASIPPQRSLWPMIAFLLQLFLQEILWPWQSPPVVVQRKPLFFLLTAGLVFAEK